MPAVASTTALTALTDRLARPELGRRTGLARTRAAGSGVRPETADTGNPWDVRSATAMSGDVLRCGGVGRTVVAPNPANVRNGKYGGRSASGLANEVEIVALVRRCGTVEPFPDVGRFDKPCAGG